MSEVGYNEKNVHILLYIFIIYIFKVASCILLGSFVVFGRILFEIKLNFDFVLVKNADILTIGRSAFLYNIYL